MLSRIKQLQEDVNNNRNPANASGIIRDGAMLAWELVRSGYIDDLIAIQSRATWLYEAEKELTAFDPQTVGDIETKRVHMEELTRHKANFQTMLDILVNKLRNDTSD